MVFGVVLGGEGGDSRNGVEPIEDAIEGHKIVSGIGHAEGRDGGPGEERGGGEGDGSE